MQATDPSSLQWWQTAIFYQIYPRSFQDSTGDGTGDIRGIISRVEHLVDIGVGAVWLSPFYPSPQFDFGYDISDFCNVDPLFGSLEDFDHLVKALHERDIKIIVDFVPGHTSHLHPWFQKSVIKEEPYSNFYVWHAGKLDKNGKRVPPNNWLSVFGGSGWAWNETRQQFYYRPFTPEQPKLNYRCPQVVDEMKNVVRFWLDRGVDGFRMDAIAVLVEAEDKSLDEPKNPKTNCPADQFEYLSHIYTDMQPQSFELIRQWSDILDEYGTREGVNKFMVIETYEKGGNRNKYRGAGGHPFNMGLVDDLDELGLSGENVKLLVDEEYSTLPEGAWPSFVLGNHDRHRIANRHGPEYADAFNILLLTLKGTPTTYYGEEIGLADIAVSFEETQDPWGKSMGPERFKVYSRDPERSPMQWNSSPNAGFTNALKSWLPPSPDYHANNVEVQANCEGSSPLKLYKTLAKLRKEPAFQNGSLTYGLVNADIFSFMREDPATSIRYLVVLNFGRKPFNGNACQNFANASQGRVVASTCSVDASMSCGHILSLQEVSLKPGDGLVIKLDA